MLQQMLQQFLFQLDSATINANNFNVTAGYRFYNLYSATISANNFNVSAGSTFFNQVSATINANDFNVTAGDRFYNTDSATISANDLTISADSFVNSHTRGDGNLITDTLTLSVAGDFDYADNYLNNGNIEATTLNLQWEVILATTMQTITLFGMLAISL